MKKTFIITVALLLSANFFAQTVNNDEWESVSVEKEKRAAITVGILQGGGSLLGADFEALLTDRLGLQVGAGFFGFGAAMNFHLKPSINSSFLSLSYWHQGAGSSFTQSMIGPTFVFRGKKWFTAQLGLGFALEKGPAFPVDMVQPPMMLLYSIGAYFPL